MPEIVNIHRAETIDYVLGLVRSLHTSETARVAIYASQPHAVALEHIARDRAGRLEQLVTAIEAGLFDRLDEEAATEAFVDAADEERYAQRDAYLNADGEDDEDDEGSESRLTRAQLDGEACTVCGADLAEGQPTVPTGYAIADGQLLAHASCAESEAV